MLSSSLTVTVLMLLSFATLVTAHLALAYGLIRTPGHALKGVLLMIPPFAWLAPFWGKQHGLLVRTWIWGISAGVYLSTLAVSLWFDG